MKIRGDNNTTNDKMTDSKPDTIEHCLGQPPLRDLARLRASD